MKITKIAASITRLDKEGIQRELLSSPPVERALSVLNEAYNKRDMEAFVTASGNPKYANNPAILKLIVKMVTLNASSTDSVTVVRNILDFLESPVDRIDKSLLPQLNSVATQNPYIAAEILLHSVPGVPASNSNEPDPLSELIIGSLKLWDCRTATMSNPVLTAIVDNLANGYSWDNVRSGALLTPRIARSPQDPFVTEISKYDLNPDTSEKLLNAAMTYRNQNIAISNNVRDNDSAGMSLAKISKMTDWSSADPDNLIPRLIEILVSSHNKNYAEWIWNTLKMKMRDPDWELKSFTYEHAGRNLIEELIELAPSVKGDLIENLKTSRSLESIKRTKVYNDLIHEGLNDPAYRDKILSMPEQCFRRLRLSPEDAAIIRDRFFSQTEEKKPTGDIYSDEWQGSTTPETKPQEAVTSQPIPKPEVKPQVAPPPSSPVKPKKRPVFDIDEEFRSLSSTHDNWYKYAVTEEMLKEAGWKENVAGSLIAAIMMVFQGATPAEASHSKNVSLEQINSAMKLLAQQTKNQHSKQRSHKMKQPAKQKVPQVAAPALPMPTDLSNDDLFQFISNNEGIKRKAYLDPSKKNMCIGVGTNIDRPNTKKVIEQELKLNYNDLRNGKIALTDAQIKTLFNHDVTASIGIAQRFVSNFNQLPTDMKKVLVDMAYNMGEAGLGQFKKLKAAVEQQDFQTAAKELQSSKWYAQVKGRGERSVEIVANLPKTLDPYSALAKL